MIENPGPLAEMPNQPAKNFYGGITISATIIPTINSKIGLSAEGTA